MYNYLSLVAVALAVFITNTVNATDLKPWYPRYLEFQPRLTYSYQHFDKVDTGGGSRSYSSNDNFLSASVQLAYDQWCGQLELLCINTRKRSFTVDDVKATVRYQLMDDIVGDPVSLVAGASLSQVFGQALHDISVFHTGHIEGELTLAVGKECACWTRWLSRWWAVGGVGLGDHGSPWLHGEVAWEKNFCLTQLVRVYANVIYGLGGNNLHSVSHFNGYGSLSYRAVDLGGAYEYAFENYATVAAGYSYRLYAHNCPKGVNTFFISLLFPFAL